VVLAADAGWSPGGRAWQAAVCLALGAALGLAGWRLAGRLLAGEALPARLTGAFALAVAVSVVSATGLGAWGLMTRRRFELVIAAVTALCLFLRVRLPSQVILRARDEPEGSGRVELSCPQILPARPSRQDDRWTAPLPLFPLCLLGALTLFAMVERSFLPPGIISYDDTSYHLSAVAAWLHTHDLRTLKFAFGDGSTTFYPLGSELWTWALLAPLRDSDVLARWSQLPFALFTLVAIAAVGRRLGLSAPATGLAVVSYWTVPRAFPDLALSAGNDHALAFAAVAGVDAALLFAQRPDRRRALYAGIVLGLLVGTKYIGVLFLPLLFLVGLVAWRDRTHPAGLSWQRSAALAGLGLGAALLVGGYTYVRTALVTGNPLFPAPLTLGSWQILPGWPGAEPNTRRLEEGSVDLFGLFWSRTDLLGPLFRYLMLPGALLAALILLWTRRRRPLGRTAAAVALSPWAVVGIFAYLHDHREIRYVFAALALAGVSLGLALERLPPRIGQRLALLLTFAWAVTALATQTTPRQAVMVTAIAVVACGLTAYLCIYEGRAVVPSPLGGGGLEQGGGQEGGVMSDRDLSMSNVLPTGGAPLLTSPLSQPPPSQGGGKTFAVLFLLVALLLPATLGLSAWTESYQSHRLDLWPDAAALERITGGAPTVIAYLGGNRPYRYAGRTLQNRLEIVPLHGPPAARFFEEHGSADFPYDWGRFPVWTRNLAALGVELVLVDRNDDPTLQSGARELRWMQTHPEQFEPVLLTETCEIRRFHAAGAGSGPR
jgi:hypothetical protein